MLAKHIGELLEIVYMDQTGKLTQRRIEIKRIRNGLVYADCLRSGEPRTFREENILAWQPSKAIRPTISVKQLAAASTIKASSASRSSGAPSAVSTPSSSALSTANPSPKSTVSAASRSTAPVQHRRSATSSKVYRQPASYTPHTKRTKVVSHVS
ncbi:hypothetical protein [Paenibacillus wulumuqiensis]|uniref:hypothetical protein n=1 Tax=Paenibacillus wulumuqiensis TaxID=1567107 RepID=UPI0009E197B9|nr:hypothetical protein [Paenibacillus wulumuqiensis]